MFLTLGSLWESATSRRAATPPVNKDLDEKLDICRDPATGQAANCGCLHQGKALNEL